MGNTREEGLVKFVLAHAVKGDAASVLSTMDKFCYEQSWMMALGDVKGKIIHREVLQARPRLALEFGGYCG